jgi:ribosomal protein S27E
MFKFIKSLFLTPTPEPEPQYWLEDVPLRPVKKYTHPGRFGKDVYCGTCYRTEHVYSFAWKEMTCTGCGERANKYKWLMKK